MPTEGILRRVEKSLTTRPPSCIMWLVGGHFGLESSILRHKTWGFQWEYNIYRDFIRDLKV